MTVSINSSFSTAMRDKLGEEQLLAMIADAGFEAVELSLDQLSLPGSVWEQEGDEAHALKLKEAAERYGLRFNQASAPVEFDWMMRDTVTLYSVVYPVMERAFAICRFLQIPRMVVEPLTHPMALGLPSRRISWNVTYYSCLAEMGRKYGVEVALKNLVRTFETAEELNGILDDVAPETVSACVDTGHCNLSAEKAPAMIRGLGSRVQSLHLNDNHGDFNQHIFPGGGQMDWTGILDALAEIGYAGDLTLHISDRALGSLDGRHGFDEDYLPVFLRFLHASAEHLAQQLERRTVARSGAGI